MTSLFTIENFYVTLSLRQHVERYTGSTEFLDYGEEIQHDNAKSSTTKPGGEFF
jgi:hypothetical protein